MQEAQIVSVMDGDCPTAWKLSCCKLFSSLPAEVPELCRFDSVQFKVFTVMCTVRKHVSLCNEILPLPALVNARCVKCKSENRS